MSINTHNSISIQCLTLLTTTEASLTKTSLSESLLWGIIALNGFMKI